ncbi:MAG TPA: DUF5780 domain-containing protein [Clostridia bacterium]
MNFPMFIIQGDYMGQCKQCGNELPDDSVFCNKCGLKVTDTSSNRLINLKKKYLIYGVIGLVFISIIISVIVILNNPINKFSRAINYNNYTEALDLYNERIKGNTDRETSVINLLKSKINDIKNDFNNNKIEFNEAITKLNTINKTELVSSDVSSAISEINRLNSSHVAYKKGKEFIDNKKYYEGLSQLKDVMPEDKNYKSAQKLINNNIKDYKNIALHDAEVAANKLDYNNAIILLNEGLAIIPNDSDLSAKKSIYETQNEEKKEEERKKKMAELEKGQEATVNNIIIKKDMLNIPYISMSVKNNSAKVIKKFTVGWMGFDKNGYPVGSGEYKPDLLHEGNAEKNIQPNETWVGDDSGWRLTNYDTNNTFDAVKFIACVREVEYYDGSKWTNQYYDYWKDEYLGKPLK